ncbi:MAG: hypothetical protein AAF602_05660, partial [Myxococcota bacterium]
YGRAKTVQGTVATRFLVFVGLPLLPLRSYVVHAEDAPQQGPLGTSTRVKTLRWPGGRFHWRQALLYPMLGWSALAAGAWVVSTIE